MPIWKQRLFTRLQNQQSAEGGEGGGGTAVDPAVQAQIDAAVSAAVATATTGLANKNRELLGSLKASKESLAAFEGIDPQAVRTILAHFASTEEASLIAAGKVDEVLEKRTARMKSSYESETKKEREAREAAEARANKFSKRVFENGIRAAASEAGLHQYAIEDALYRAATTFSLDDDGNPAPADGVYGKDGKPLTLKEWFADQKEKAPHWFPAQASGSGATQSASGGNGKTIREAAFNALTPKQRAAAMASGMTVIS